MLSPPSRVDRGAMPEAVLSQGAQNGESGGTEAATAPPLQAHGA